MFVGRVARFEGCGTTRSGLPRPKCREGSNGKLKRVPKRQDRTDARARQMWRGLGGERFGSLSARAADRVAWLVRLGWWPRSWWIGHAPFALGAQASGDGCVSVTAFTASVVCGCCVRACECGGGAWELARRPHCGDASGDLGARMRSRLARCGMVGPCMCPVRTCHLHGHR